MTGSNKLSLIVSIFMVAMLFSVPTNAAHIVGGEITYRCLGTGKYEFTMKLYRDCFGGGAPFDSAPSAPFPGTVSIYQGNSTIPMNFNGLNHISLAAPVITNIPPNLSNPCLDPPNDVCVEEGVYKFIVDLPVISESYHIVYQRCCRNGTITNINSPGGTGATYYVQLTPAAQQVCNSSPVFDNFPPIVICAGEPIDFDHSATDPNGDHLEYELCRSLTGGGTDQNTPEAPNGVAPNPDLPPPYTPVSFVSPPYSFTNPLSANPALSIDPNTGFLTGVPNVAGQFVVGVCVKEYRGGQLLSQTFRDFQFNVEQCEFNVRADIMEDDTVTLQGQQYFVVTACGINSVDFVNQSTKQSNINSVLWEFDINGTTETSTQWSPTFDFPGPDTYFGRLLLNPGIGSSECADTAYIEVNVYPGINADFTFDYDTCVAGPVTFTDLSVSDAGANAITSWDWSFGDGNTSNAPDPVHTYMVPGELPARLRVRDFNGCEDDVTKIVRYFPVPEELIVAPSEFIGCQPASIFFDNLSFPINEEYDILWDFGDGGSSTNISPTHLYEDLGVFTVSLDIVSPLGCANDTTWNNLITILPSPVAGFSFAPEQPSNLLPEVTFTDESFEPSAWRWTFGDVGASTQQNPVFTFPDTGMQTIQLVVFHESGCTDTMIQYLDVIPEVRYFLPNAFSPNGDGFNDGFRGNGVLDGATNFSLSIWNRYGEMLFETDDPKKAWNGRKNNDGKLAAQGVYVVVVSYREPRGKLVELRGYATLIK
ncbi:MAG TPA: PKD domain-containing protein [Bacteroidetes bacterium]|nr:PKD domain-containing protein [Bacteroidota bacterium]